MINRNCLKTAVILIAVLAFIACGGGKAIAGDYSYDLTKDGKGIVITKYTGKPGKVVIPAKIENLPVVEIGFGAFDGTSAVYSGTSASNMSVGSKANERAGITSITIPNTVKKIGDMAFANTAITKIVIPDSVTVLATEEYALGCFTGCKQLAEIRLSDNIETLKGFAGLTALKKINLPKNLKRIEHLAFADCIELTELIIPNTLTKVEFVKTSAASGNAAFSGCKKLPIKTRQALQALGYKGEF